MTAKFMSLVCCRLWKPDHNDSMSEKNLTRYIQFYFESTKSMFSKCKMQSLHKKFKRNKAPYKFFMTINKPQHAHYNTCGGVCTTLTSLKQFNALGSYASFQMQVTQLWVLLLAILSRASPIRYPVYVLTVTVVNTHFFCQRVH